MSFANSAVRLRMYRVLLILATFLSVECQMCTKRVKNSRWVPQTYVNTFRENYVAKCWYGKCTRTRIGSYTDTKWIQKIFIVTKKSCCDGYIQQDDYDQEDNIGCKPVCIPACENGYCDKPGKCKCNSGYFFESDSTYRCLPFCLTDCGRGHCKAPDTCECDFGYIFQNDTCKAVCNEPCINGTCIAPETCDCKIGYRKSENNTCEPYCSKGCTNGSCISPELCQCDDGFKKSADECIPYCENDCVNGNCTAPDKCTCHAGYKMHNGSCVPHCNTSCDNGECIAPNTCKCNEGWANNTTGLCKPICLIPCGNGTCVAPEQCQCDAGYVNLEGGSCIPECEKCDHGKCIAPGECECDEGWIKNTLNICTALCITPCGRGTCVQPNVCECYTGYKQVDGLRDEVCASECELCGGTCVGLYKCNCEYSSKDIIFDPSCTEYTEFNTTDCDESTVTTEGSTITESSFGKESTNDLGAVTRLVGFSFYNDGDITTDSNIYNTENEDVRKLIKDENSGYPHWIYFLLLGIILVVSTFVCIIIFVSRRRIQRYFKGGSYVIEDRSSQCKDFEKSQALSCSIPSNISYSDIKNSRENNLI